MTTVSALKIARFLTVGGTVMLVLMALNWAFAHVMSEQAAYLVSYPIALGLHFVLNKWWTFADRSALRPRQIGEYVVMVVVTFAIQWTVFTALTRWTTLPNWAAAGAGSIVQIGITYVAMSRRVFAPAAGK